MSSSPATPTAAPNADGGAASAASPTGSSFTSAPGDKSFDKELFDASAIEVVYQRVTKGRHDLKKLKTYFEARAEMSRVYVKAFNKASAQPDLEDSSSIGNVWKEIRETGNSQVKQQEAFIAGCMDIAVVLESQIVEVKKSKTTLHATWTKLVADVKKKQQMHDKSKDVYYERLATSKRESSSNTTNRDRESIHHSLPACSHARLPFRLESDNNKHLFLLLPA